MTSLQCQPVSPAPYVGPSSARGQANFFARPKANDELSSTSKFTVWLDHTDRVVCVPAAWESFLAMNRLPEVDRENVLGRPVTRFIEDETVRECYRLLLERARRQGRPLKIHSRCDRPGAAQSLQLKFAPMSAGTMECTWSFLCGPAAEQIALTARPEYAAGDNLRMCSWCRLVHVAAVWQPLEIAAAAIGLLDHDALPPITHGICPDCSAELLAETSAAHLHRVPVALVV